MSIFENAGEPFRRIRRQARQRRELAIQPSIMRAQSSLESEFNHDPISHPADRELYEGDVGILIIHGFTGSPHSMRPIADHFIKLGYPVEMPRLAGHGTHWRDMVATEYKEWVDGVDEGYWKLLNAGYRVIVIGISMGGCIAANLAARHDVLGTVLINPYFVDVNPMMQVAHRVAPIFPSLKSVGSDIARPGVDEGAYPRTPTVSVRQLHLLGRETRELIPLLRAPVLYLRSLHDHVVSDSSHRYFLEHCSATVNFKWLTHSYHVPTLDYDAELVLSVIQDFVVDCEA